MVNMSPSNIPSLDLGLLHLTNRRYWNSIPYRLKVGVKEMFPELRLRRLVGNGVAIRTQTSIRQRLALYEIARDSVKNKCFVEIGSYLGATAVVLAAAMSRQTDGVVYCIDTWENDAMSEGAWSTYEVFMMNIQPWTSIIKPIKGLSSQVGLPVGDGEVDLVFIDGDHAYQAVKLDVERYAKFVRPGGFLVFHDQAFYPSVTKVVGELLECGGWYIWRSIENITFLKRHPAWLADTKSTAPVSPLK